MNLNSIILITLTLTIIKTQKIGDPIFMPKIIPITNTINRTDVIRVYCTANQQTFSQTSSIAIVNNRIYQFLYNMSVIIFEDLDTHYNDDEQKFFFDIGTKYELMNNDWKTMLKTNLDYYARYNFIMKNIPNERQWRITMSIFKHSSYGAGFFSYLGFSRYFYLLLVKWDKTPPLTNVDVPQTQHIILSNYTIIISISAETDYFALVLIQNTNAADGTDYDQIFVYHQQINERSIPKGMFCYSETGEQYFHQRKPKDLCQTTAQLSQILRELNFGFTAKKNLFLVSIEHQYVIIVDSSILKSYDIEYPYQRLSLDDVFVCNAAKLPAIYPTLYPKGKKPTLDTDSKDIFGIDRSDGKTLFSPNVWLIIVSLNLILVILIGTLCIVYVSRRKLRKDNVDKFGSSSISSSRSTSRKSTSSIISSKSSRSGSSMSPSSSSRLSGISSRGKLSSSASKTSSSSSMTSSSSMSSSSSSSSSAATSSTSSSSMLSSSTASTSKPNIGKQKKNLMKKKKMSSKISSALGSTASSGLKSQASRQGSSSTSSIVIKKGKKFKKFKKLK